MKLFLTTSKSRGALAAVIAVVAALTSALAIFASAGAASAAAKFTGLWTVTYLSGPSHTATATQCLSFTNDSSILGFTNSGTWVATTFSGFQGNFVVDGKDLRVYGTFGGGSGVITHHATKSSATLYKGGFDDFAPTSTGASAANDGNITLAKGCTAVAAVHAAHADPSR